MFKGLHRRLTLSKRELLVFNEIKKRGCVQRSLLEDSKMADRLYEKGYLKIRNTKRDTKDSVFYLIK